MWANRPLKPARASTARQRRERPRPTPPLSRPGGRCLLFDRVWPSPVFSSAALQTYAVRRHTAQVLVPVGTVAPAASRACMVNAARLHSHETGVCSTASPTTRRRVCRYRTTRLASASGIVAPFPPRTGANGSRRYPGNPNHWCAGRLRLVDQLPIWSASTAAPVPRNGPRSPASAAPATAPPRARRRARCRAPEPRQRRSRQRSPILDRRRRLPVRQPPDEALDSISVSPPSSCASSSTETPIRSVDSPASNVSVPLVAVHIVPGP